MKIIIFVIEAIISYLITGCVHELGHVVTGIYYGWKFEIFVLGPIGFKRKDGKVKCYLEKNIVYWAGVGATTPRENKKDNINIWKKVLLAGPVVSIIFGLIIFPLALDTQILFLIFLSFMSIGIGIVSLIPMKTGVLYTDGGRALRLKKGGKEGREETALFNLSEFDNIEDEYKQISYSDIDELINSNDLAIKYYGYYYAFKYFSREGKDEEARCQILKMRELEKSVPKVIIKDCMVNENEHI